MQDSHPRNGTHSTEADEFGARAISPLTTGGLVLCVSADTNLALREIIPSLEKLGHEVQLLRPEEVSLALLRSRPYSLMLLDISTSDSSSYRLCEQSRHVLDIPVMLILRGAARADVLRGYQAGADAYLFFPFDDRELESRLIGLLRRHPLNRPPS